RKTDLQPSASESAEFIVSITNPIVREARSQRNSLLKHEESNCLVCGSKSAFYCQKERATYYRCHNCGTIYQNPMISLREMLDYAEREYSDGGLYKEYVDAKALKYATFERRIKKIASLTTGKKILDVGCGCGYFIDVALKEGFDAYGVEFSSVAISYAE